MSGACSNIILISRAAACCLLSLFCMKTNALASTESRANSFVALKDFSSFARGVGTNAEEIVMTSPIIRAELEWNELIASWNVDAPSEAYLKFEVRPLYPEATSKFYSLAQWSSDGKTFSRENLGPQRDGAGHVSTDTLILKQPCRRFQARITIGGKGRKKCRVKFLGFSLSDTTATVAVLPPNRKAWGKTLDVPERSQMAYPNGKVLCSPTTVSMMMTFWSKKLGRRELDHDVPEIVDAVYDLRWDGTGNWPFNMAYVGSFPGMRAYVSRFSDVSELEDWIASGIPVGLSLCYNRLRGRDNSPPSGHLIVCVGFTPEGDVIVNDPGTSKGVRKTFPRKNLINAWAYSHNAVYLIYPEGRKVPIDRFGHWDSKTAAKFFLLEKTNSRAGEIPVHSPKSEL